MPRQHGFTLTEVLIVVAIVAIIAAVAMPSYQDSTRKTRRTEGQSLLLEVSQRMERHYTEFGRYPTTLAETGTTAADTLVVSHDSESRYYRLSPVTLTATAFEISAVPQGGQASDDCGNLTLTHTGLRGRSGTGDRCW